MIENLHERNLYWNYRLVLMHCACYSYGPSEEGTIYLYLFYYINVWYYDDIDYL
jgi:hypothetical protein